jgi:hypothetical protein
VDIEHRGLWHEDGVAGLHLEVGAHVAAAVHRRHVDLEPALAAVARDDRDDPAVAAGGDAAGERQHVRQPQPGMVDRVLPGSQHLSQHGHLAAAHVDERDAHVRIHEEAAACESRGDRDAGFDRRLAGDHDFADQRQHDRATLGEAQLAAEFGILEHRDAHGVAGTELFARLRRRSAARDPERE